jgi:hypothetical protein
VTVGSFRKAPRRDRTQLAGQLRLWDIFRSEAVPGRAGPRYALNNTDELYGGHVVGSPIDVMFRRADGLQLLGEAIQRTFRPKEYAEASRKRADTLSKEPELDEKVTVIGRYPQSLGKLDPVDARGDLLRRGAQVAGVGVRDAMLQAPQSIWWLGNATEALAGLASQAVQRGALDASPGIRVPFTQKRVLAREDVSPGTQRPHDTYKMPGAAIYSAIPLIGLAGLVNGTLVREPGYKAVFPEDSDSNGPEYDTSVSQNPVGEAAMRVLGWKGGLRAYGDFVEERPDVTKGEFLKYSAYLQQRTPVKATLEGIHGPEINLFGKSLPLLTGVVPLAAGLLGARYGMRMAGNRLAGRGLLGRKAPGAIPTRVTVDGRTERIPDRFAHTEQAYQMVLDAKDDPETLGDEVAGLRRRAHLLQREVDREKLAGVIAGSTLLGGTAAVATAGLEVLRQANNWANNREELAADVNEAVDARKKERQAKEAAALAGLAGFVG